MASSVYGSGAACHEQQICKGGFQIQPLRARNIFDFCQVKNPFPFRDLETMVCSRSRCGHLVDVSFDC